MPDRAAHQHDPLGPHSGCRASSRATFVSGPVGRARRRRARIARRGTRPHPSSTGCARRGQRRTRRARFAVDVVGDVRLTNERPIGAAATGTSPRPASSSTLSAFSVVFSSVWLPWTVVTPSSSTSGLASASSSAMASSCRGRSRGGSASASCGAGSRRSRRSSAATAARPGARQRALPPRMLGECLLAVAPLEQRDDEARRERVAGRSAVHRPRPCGGFALATSSPCSRAPRPRLRTSPPSALRCHLRLSRSSRLTTRRSASMSIGRGRRSVEADERRLAGASRTCRRKSRAGTGRRRPRARRRRRPELCVRAGSDHDRRSRRPRRRESTRPLSVRPADDTQYRLPPHAVPERLFDEVVTADRADEPHLRSEPGGGHRLVGALAAG